MYMSVLLSQVILSSPSLHSVWHANVNHLCHLLWTERICLFLSSTSNYSCFVWTLYGYFSANITSFMSFYLSSCPLLFLLMFSTLEAASPFKCYITSLSFSFSLIQFPDILPLIIVKRSIGKITRDTLPRQNSSRSSTVSIVLSNNIARI